MTLELHESEAEFEAGFEIPKAVSDVIAASPIRVLEALLFASSEPLSINSIRDRLPKDTDVGGLLMELQKSYEGRGVALVDMEGSWAFRTAKDVGPALQVTKDVQRKLSRAAMETLAIIAYHQPVTRTEIENIRGIIVHKGTLDVLMECGWIKPGRRRETPGRPVTWVTTSAFMDQFGLESLNDLPGLDDLKASGLLDRRPAIDNVMMTGSLFGDETEEADLAAAEDEDYEEDEKFEDEAESEDDKSFTEESDESEDDEDSDEGSDDDDDDFEDEDDEDDE